MAKRLPTPGEEKVKAQVLVHTEIDAGGAVEALRNAEKIVIVPGYGLAVAQAAPAVVFLFEFIIS